MTITSRINTGHADLIHDFVYDFYGKRLATCSSDQTLKIWRKDSGKDMALWTLDHEIKHRHRGSIQRLCWAHPKFGDIIATCASDYHVHLFVSSGSEFSFMTQLSKAKDIVRDVQFAPEHYHLTLGAASADGTIQIWESQDITDLKRWACKQTIEVGSPANCLTWCSAKYGLRSFAVGTSNGADIWYHDAKANEWQLEANLITGCEIITIHWAPNLGRRYHLIALGARSPKEPLRVAKILDGNIELFSLVDNQNEEDDLATVWRVCWNMTGTILAASLDNGRTIVWKYDTEQGFKVVLRA